MRTRLVGRFNADPMYNTPSRRDVTGPMRAEFLSEITFQIKTQLLSEHRLECLSSICFYCSNFEDDVFIARSFYMRRDYKNNDREFTNAANAAGTGVLLISGIRGPVVSDSDQSTIVIIDIVILAVACSIRSRGLHRSSPLRDNSIVSAVNSMSAVRLLRRAD